MSTTTAAPSRQRRGTRDTAELPTRSIPTRRRPYSSPARRPGSRQQLTVRGRRVGVRERKDRSIVWTWVILVSLFIAGIAMAMYLSGLSTEQSYQLSDAEETSTTLDNEIEALNRDVENASSTQNIAAEATKLGMEVPGQSGVLNVDGDQVDEVRPSDNSTGHPMTDINGEVGNQGPTSDPEATGDVEGLAPPQAVPDAPEAADAGDAPAPGDAADAAAPGGAGQSGELPYAP